MEEASCNNLANKNQVDDALDLGDKNRFKHKQIQKFLKSQTFDLSFLIGKSYFDDDGSQIYLIFGPVFKSFKTFTCTIDKIIQMQI